MTTRSTWAFPAAAVLISHVAAFFICGSVLAADAPAVRELPLSLIIAIAAAGGFVAGVLVALVVCFDDDEPIRPGSDQYGLDLFGGCDDAGGRKG